VPLILLVEDEAIIALFTSFLLEDEGFEVAIAHDGVVGIQIAEARSPHLIISDLMMPGMDGLEMIRLLRSRGCELPIILVTSVPEAQIVERLYDAYLSKPYVGSELLPLVRELLKKQPR
jgi:CheY-like chemotaxis protein